jgi:hypothetical protein
MTRRAQFSTIRNGVRCFVIAEETRGETEFWIQEPGEVRWYRHDPSPVERRAATELLLRPAGAGWPLAGANRRRRD